MKIIIATGIYPPDIGGPATYSKKLGECLSKEGWDVSVLTYSDELKSNGTGDFLPKESSPKIKVIKILRSYNVFARYFWYTWNLVKLAKKADLIYAQGPVSEGLPALIASRMLGKKYILKVVGDCAWERWEQKIQNSDKKNFFTSPDDFQKLSKIPFKTKILKIVERSVAKKASRVITPSLYLKKIVMAWGIAEEKITVIYNAVEEVASCEKNADNQKGDIILSIGRLVPWKGFDALVDVMPQLWKLNENFKLIIVGDGPDYEKLKCRIHNDNIVLMGKLEHGKLLELMGKAKMFVLNSGYEGLSHVIIEAMQNGLPVATSNIGGNPELVEDRETGLLFEYNNKEKIKDAIIKLWKGNRLREHIVLEAYKKVQKFNFKKMIAETKRTLSSNF